MKFPDLTLALLSAFLLIFLSSPVHVADMADELYQLCGGTGNYTAISTYELNLQTLLSNLTSSATNSSSSNLNFGFAKSIVGSVPNQISGGASLLSLTPPAENAPALAPSVAPAPALQEKKKTSTTTILTISLPLLLIAFVVTAGLSICLIKRRKSGLTKSLLSNNKIKFYFIDLISS